MSSPGRIAVEWATFVEAVGLADAPADQKRQMRRAFYAGANALLRSITADFSAGSEPTDADEAIISGVRDELEAFVADVLAGRA